MVSAQVESTHSNDGLMSIWLEAAAVLVTVVHPDVLDA